MRNKLAAISLNSEKRPNYSVKAFIAQPDPLQENLGGKLFALIEVAAKKSDAEKIIDFIIGDLDFNYYQDEKLSLREKIAGLKIENIFETVLVKTNKNLLDFLEKEKLRLGVGDISATLGVVYENEVHFSSNGSNHAFLLYRKDDGAYRVMDIAGGENENNGISKLFTALVSGSIPSKSYFIAANEPLSEYLHNEDLIDIITKLPPASAAEQIKNIMAEMNAYVSFAGLIIKNTASDEIPEDYDEPVLAPRRESVPVDLPSSELATEKILASKSSLDAQQLSDLSGKMIKKMNFFPNLIQAVKRLWPFKKSESRPAAIGPLETAHYENPRAKRQRWLLAIAAGILLIFTINILITRHQQANNLSGNNPGQAKDWESQLTQKQTKIDNYLLYNNENEAKTALAEFKGLLEQFAPKYGKEANYSGFQAKYEEQLAQTEHLVDFSDPREIANFSTLNPEAKLDNLEFISGRLYAAGANAEAYKLTLKDNLLKALPLKAPALEYPALDNKSGVIYYFDGANNIVALNTKTDSASTTKISLKSGQQIAGIDTYNNRLYALDKANSQLYRFSLGANGYEKGETRLKDKPDLSDAVGLAIDKQSTKSNIYILKGNGELLKFYDGQKQSFALEAVQPAIAGASSFVAAKDFYILSSDGRVIVFDSEGHFKHQYRFSGISGLKDIAVDEAGGKLYLLAGTGIRTVDLIK